MGKEDKTWLSHFAEILKGRENLSLKALDKTESALVRKIVQSDN